MTTRVKVGVASASRFSLHPEGEYAVTVEGNCTRYTPVDEKSARMRVDNIKIGLGFHWQQEVEMLLPGIVEVYANPDGTADLVNQPDIDDYLTSVISSEMSGDAPLEFLKAHAIVSRSWVMGKILHRHTESGDGKLHTDREVRNWEDTADHDSFDVCADDHCQRYQGVARVNPDVSRAVSETSGLVLADHDGCVIDARFSKCCGGKTELFSTCWQDIDYPYLASFDDPYCRPDRLPSARLQRVLDTVLMKYDRRTTDYFAWTHRVTADEVAQAMKTMFGLDTGTVVDIQADMRGPAGRITRLRIEGANGTFFVGKELAIRRLLSSSCLYSSAFDISRAPDSTFLLTGRGWGHGVGLCQIGGAVMAAEGASCEKILSFYYPETKLLTI